MKWRSLLGAGVLATTVMTTVGCSQFYNGSTDLASLLGSKAPANKAKPAPPQTSQAEKPSPTPPQPFTAASPRTDNTADQRQALNLFELYGQVESAAVPPRTSPLDGPTNLRRITFTSEGGDFDPVADPTGQALLFASTRHRNTPDLYLKRTNGTSVTQLTNDPARDVMPAISPDGRRIAFTSDRAGNWDIYIMDARGGQPVQLTNDPTQEVHPSFSPDGTRLAYCTYGGPSGQWEMVVVDLQNPGVKRFIDNGLFPTWSPVGDKILFQRARQRGTRWFSVWTVDLVDGEATPPTEIAASANAAVIAPAWSPDGERVVFCTVLQPTADDQSRPTQADVWVVNTDGSGRVRLTDGTFANLQPTWASDGTIYFVSDRGPEGRENVWAIRPGESLQLAQPANNGPGNPAAAVPTD